MALTTPQPHTTVPVQPRKIIGRQVVVLRGPPWPLAQLKRERERERERDDTLIFLEVQCTKVANHNIAVIN